MTKNFLVNCVLIKLWFIFFVVFFWLLICIVLFLFFIKVFIPDLFVELVVLNDYICTDE